MDELDIFDDLIFGMSERTKNFIIAFLDVAGVKLAKFCFISVGMVQLLEFIVRELTHFIIALFLIAKKVAVCYVRGSAFILVIVIVKAGFSLMVVFRIKKHVLLL